MTPVETLDKKDVAVESPDLGESAELLQSLLPELSEEDERELADRILSDHQHAIQDRSEWESRLAEWEDAYYNRVPAKSFPWEGAANFHVPVTMMGVETLKPRLIEGVLGQVPPVMLVPSKGADEHRKDVTEDFLNWQLMTEIPLEELVHQSAHLYLQPGLVVAKTYWKVTRMNRRVIREFPRGTSIREVFESLFGSEMPQDLEPKKGRKKKTLTWTGTIPTTPQGGRPLDVMLKMKFLDEEDGEAIQVLVDQEVVEEQPAIDLLDAVDLVVPVKGGADINAHPWCQIRLWMYEEDLRDKVAVGRFSAEAVQALFDLKKPPSGGEGMMDATAYRAGKAQTEGVEDQGPSTVRRDQYEIIEDYRRRDIDGDGQVEEIIVWVAKDLPSRILGWDYLANVYAHGRRPIRVGRFLPIPFRFYPLSFAEMIKGIQDEINAIHNQKTDYGTLQNLPFYFYRASATMPPVTQQLRPGAGIPIDNPQQDLLFPQWKGSTAFAAQDEAILYQYLERLSGLTDLSFGRQPNRVGATRTARGTQTLLSEAGLRFKVALQGFQRFWVGILSDVLALDQEYLPPKKEFRVTGRRPTAITLKDRSEIRGQYNLRLATSTDNLNREQMRQDATSLAQFLMNPALFQAGVIGMKGLRRLSSDFCKAFGRDPDFYLEAQAAIRSPEEELMIFASGQYLSPVMGENIPEHIRAHRESLQDPDLAPEVRRMVNRHLQETFQLQQAQQVARTLQQQLGGRPPQGQQATNAAIGRQAQALPPGQPPTASPAPPGSVGPTVGGGYGPAQ